MLSNTSHGGNNVAARISSYTSCLIKTFTKRIVLRFVGLYCIVYTPRRRLLVSIEIQHTHIIRIRIRRIVCVCLCVMWSQSLLQLYVLTWKERVNRFRFKVLLSRRFRKNQKSTRVCHDYNKPEFRVCYLFRRRFYFSTAPIRYIWNLFASPRSLLQ